MAAELSFNALRVLEARYLRRNAAGETIESPEELFARVARAVSQAELLYGSAASARLWEVGFLAMLVAHDFLPNSPTLMIAGTSLGQLAACFVLPIADTMESIFGTLRDMALVQRTGGGTGFSFSHLRPAGDHLSSTGGTASGPVSFLRIYDCATENVKQGGRRRGANMGVLRFDHPGIHAFIAAKREGVSLQNFNLSIGVAEAFMAAVASGDTVALHHPRDGHETGRCRAHALFTSICEAAWATGDPGLIFLDAIARANPLSALGAIECTNPCREVPLLPYECCTLGSINLSHLVVDDDGRTQIDWPRLRELVHDGVRFLDDVISINRYPLNRIAVMTNANRTFGLGVMGFAEMLIRLGVSYADEAALRIAGYVMATISAEVRATSGVLAGERGPYPSWERSRECGSGLPLRNATRTSIAPTGTISIIAGTSSGIEPLFALAYRRHVLDGAPLVEVNPLFLEDAQRAGMTAEMIDRVTHVGSLRGVEGVPAEVARRFVTALELPAAHHVRTQAAFQRHVDNAVSKTVNLPPDATPADVATSYRQAHALGCKGITVFRSGAREAQVLELGTGEAAYEREYFTSCDPGACRL
jgi:ribonucleoside-diphosphate reductase alpha chain